MKSKPQYGKLMDSRTFPKREEAEEWAKKKKEEYKLAGESAKVDVNFEEVGSQWKVKLYLKL
jgi:hypothetical protein